MKAKKRWYELLLPTLAALLVLLTGTVQTAKAYTYGIDCDFDYQEYESSDGSGEYFAWANATSDAGHGNCECIASAATQAQNTGSGTAESWSYGWHMTYWTWNGPPESTPPGGTLSWQVSGNGVAEAGGHNYLGAPGDHANTDSSGASEVSGSGTEVSAYGGGDAWGYAVDKDDSDCDFSTSADPSEDLDITASGASSDGKQYEAYVEWDFESSDDETIASGTSYVFFIGVVACASESSVSTSGTAQAWSTAYTNASGGGGATFD
jgi:hypothetical protein